MQYRKDNLSLYTKRKLLKMASSSLLKITHITHIIQVLKFDRFHI